MSNAEETADRELLELFLEHVLDRYRSDRISRTEAREDLLDLIEIMTEHDVENARRYMITVLEEQALAEVIEETRERIGD